MFYVLPLDRFLILFVCLGRQQNPEHGTSRNIPEHSGTSRNMANYHKMNRKKLERKKAIKETTKTHHPCTLLLWKST